MTGIELFFTLLYVIPITFAVWFRSRYFGFWLASLSAVASAGTEIHQRVVVGNRLRGFDLGRDMRPDTDAIKR